MPIAVEPGGIGYAVLMATAEHLEDLAYGFAWSERLIDRPDQIEGVQAHRTPDGVILRMNRYRMFHDVIVANKKALRHR